MSRITEMLRRALKTELAWGLGMVTIALAALLLAVVVAPSSGDVTIKVEESYRGPALSDSPSMNVSIIDGDGAFEAGKWYQLEYHWKLCDGCHKSVWADGGESMRKANNTFWATFLRDKCYRIPVRESSQSNGIGNPHLLFGEGNQIKEVPCSP